MVSGLLRFLGMWKIVFLFIARAISGIIFISDPLKRLQFTAGHLNKRSRDSIKLLNIKVTVKGLDKISKDKNYLVVANHVSYLDIIVIASAFPALFVTSVEVKNSPFQGFMSSLGGSLFVERRKKSGLHGEISAIAQTVARGLSVVIFPEGTSSNGETVLPFKSALFAVAGEAGVDVLPACLHFTSINGEPVSAKNRDRIFYYGDIVFLKHLLRLPFLKSAEVTLSLLPPVSPRDFSSRKELSDEIHRRILEEFHAGN